MEQVEFDLPASIRMALDRLEAAGYPSYVVGGAVRDQLAGKQPHDYDVCTAARPEQVEQLFADQTVIETGLKHGTVTVLLDGMPVEITTFRTEGAYSDGRRPDSVSFVDDIERDLARRDFTINAMAWSPVRGLCDPFGGQADLQRRCIRCVGDPDTRLKEDALRILRALRFAAQRGFVVEPVTAAALHRNRERLAQVSAERITAELLQLLCGAHVGAVLMEFSDIIAQILPEIQPMIGFDQHNAYHKYTVWEHSVRAVEGIRPDPLLRLAALLHDVGKPDTFSRDERGVGHFYGHPARSRELAEQMVQRLRLPVQMERQLLYLVRHHDTPLGSNTRHVRRKLAVHGEETFRALLAIKKADGIGQGTTPQNLTELLETERLLEQVLTEDSCLTRRDLAVNGNDLIAWGARGRAVGYYLSAMLNRVLDDPSCNTRERLHAVYDGLRAQESYVELTVNGMSARCCVRQVRQLLAGIPDITRTDITLDSGRIVVYGRHLPLEQIREVLAAAGYEVAI
ncbi:HD domain-containing protein [Butyricicoccus porcorum]|uniref:HD domain-containing protein n=1 Tax=Butyricicoccus porcorum TaxID=1945634 RepID=UPI000B34CAE3|nr:HD domain-containing protein [Butyricicoccus porcorum]